MLNTVSESFDTWITAQTIKSKGRGRSSDNQTEYGLQKLRELILELAVRGKLVPQDSNDEPASELLKKIAKEKAKLIKEGKLKKQDSLPDISETELPFSLPKNWSAERLQRTSHLITKGSTPTSYGFTYKNSGVRFIKVENIDKGRIVTDYKSQFIDEETNQFLQRSKLESGDLLFSIAGTIGKTCIVYEEDLPANTNQALAIIRGTARIFEPKFLLIELDSFVSSRTKERARGGAMNNVSLGDLNELILYIPPMAEQHRIVAKVDELMALCDKLEQQQTDSTKAHELLVNTLLNTLTNAKDNKELQEAWQRIENNFDVLFTTEQSIDKLKETILQLAVMGKLVSQDPNDEPASELLKKIAKEKAKLIKEGKIKKQKPLPQITDDEKPFELPERWAWVRLNNAIDVRDGTHDSPKDADGPNTYPLVTSKNFSDGEINFDQARRISERDHINISKRSFVEKYDILFSMIGGNLGNQVIVEDERPFSVKNVALFKYYNKKLTSPFFMKKFFEYLAFDLQSQAAGGAQPFVSLGFLRNLVVALPLTDEQHRIVAKVDELFAICDKLKERIKESETTKVELADAVVAGAVG